MNKKIIGAAAVLTFLVGCGCQQNDAKDTNVQEGDQTGANAITYVCDGQTIKADFNNDTDPKTVTLYAQEKNASVTLPNVESDSGAKYADNEFTFWTHQGEATVEINETGQTMKCTEEKSTVDNEGDIVDANGNVVPQDCETWFDGCNNCQVGDNGVLACTRKFCDPSMLQEPKCLDSDDDMAKQKCAEAGGVWNDEADSCFEDPATMAGEGEK